MWWRSPESRITRSSTDDAEEPAVRTSYLFSHRPHRFLQVHAEDVAVDPEEDQPADEVGDYGGDDTAVPGKHDHAERENWGGKLPTSKVEQVARKHECSLLRRSSCARTAVAKPIGRPSCSGGRAGKVMHRAWSSQTYYSTGQPRSQRRKSSPIMGVNVTLNLFQGLLTIEPDAETSSA